MNLIILMCFEFTFSYFKMILMYVLGEANGYWVCYINKLPTLCISVPLTVQMLVDL